MSAISDADIPSGTSDQILSDVELVSLYDQFDMSIDESEIIEIAELIKYQKFDPMRKTTEPIKVDSLKPGTYGHTLIVKVVDSNIVLHKGQAVSRIVECLVGDETGTILFTARNDQVDVMKPGASVILSNAKIDMFKGSMRLAVGKYGRIEVTEPAAFEVKRG